MKQRILTIHLENNSNEDAEHDDAIIVARVLRLIEEGYNRGYEPTWSIDETETEPAEPDWKEIALKLWQDVNFAAANLKSPGGVLIYCEETKTSRHWKDRFADSLELLPGIEVDREAMHALDLPKKERIKFFKEQAARKAQGQETQTKAAQ